MTLTINLNSDFISTAASFLGNGSLAIGGWLQGDTDFFEQRFIFGSTQQTVTQKPPRLILDIAIAPAPVQLVNVSQSGNGFQFSFASQIGFSNAIQFRTNLIGGSDWRTWSNVPSDGTFKTIQIPLSVFSPAQQGFVRVLTE